MIEKGDSRDRKETGEESERARAKERERERER